MDTKEAVEELENMIFISKLGCDLKIRKEQFSDYIDKFNGIIVLLKCGEKCKEENKARIALLSEYYGLSIKRIRNMTISQFNFYLDGIKEMEYWK